MRHEGVVLLVALAGCAWWQSHGGQAERDVAQLAVCVLQHSSEAPEQIAAECSAQAVEDVIRILEAHRAAAAREHEGCGK